LANLPSSSPGRLELLRNDGELAHFLDGRKVERGTLLELLLEGGIWLRGQYEWSGTPERWAGLRVELGGLVAGEPGGWRPAAVLALHPEAMVRRAGR
jgi:hypothetical protein